MDGPIFPPKTTGLLSFPEVLKAEAQLFLGSHNDDHVSITGACRPDALSAPWEGAPAVRHTLQPQVLVKQATGARRHLSWEALGRKHQLCETSRDEHRRTPWNSQVVLVGDATETSCPWVGATQAQVTFTTARPLLPEPLGYASPSGHRESQSPH